MEGLCELVLFGKLSQLKVPFSRVGDQALRSGESGREANKSVLDVKPGMFDFDHSNSNILANSKLPLTRSTVGVELVDQ